MPNVKITIIGYGAVGKTIPTVFVTKKNRPHIRVIYNIIDPLHNERSGPIEDSEYVFICVPTPSTGSGESDVSSIMFYLKYLVDIQYTGVVLLKSTVTPTALQTEIIPAVSSLNFSYYPEFLREKHADEDALSPSIMCLSYNNDHTIGKLNDLFVNHTHFNARDIIATRDHVSLSLFKYMLNSFLAMKVIYMNQYKDLCDAHSVDWGFMRHLIKTEGRIGNTHTGVGSGFDTGYGGKCFPKDVKAIITSADKVGVDLTLLKETHRYNEEIRK